MGSEEVHTGLGFKGGVEVYKVHGGAQVYRMDPEVLKFMGSYGRC